MTTYLTTEVDWEQFGDGAVDEDAHVAIRNGEAENGFPTAGPLSWLNSAQIHAKLDEDAVYLSVSIGDPRGAFSFCVRRLTDGRIVIHAPHPGESLPHMQTAQLHEGTLVIVGDSGQPLVFEDDEVEEDA